MPTNTSSTIIQPRLVLLDKVHEENNIECSIHTLPKPLLREFKHIFPEIEGNDTMQLYAIATNQKAKHDLVAIGDHIEAEKDRLLNVFLSFAHDFCQKIQKLGYWADYIDPCSGLPMLTRNCNKVYSEVESMQVLLNYRAYSAGFCKILVHPKWGSSVYPATMFVRAKEEDVVQLLKSYDVLKLRNETNTEMQI